MFLPTRRCLLLLFALTPIWLLPGGSFLGSWAVLLVLLASGLDVASLPDRKTLEVHRRLPPAFYWGQESIMALEISNTGRFPWQGCLFDDFPEALGCISRPVPWKLRTGQKQTFEWTVCPTRRGRAHFGLTVLRTMGRLGLWQREILVNLSQEVIILPKLKEEGAGFLKTRGPRSRELRRRLQSREGEVDHVRRMRDGDDWRDIDWKSSARRDRWVVRQRRFEPGRQLSVFVDCGRLMGDKIGDHTRLDYSLNATVQLAKLAEAQGDTFALTAFSNRIEAELPLASKGQVSRTLKALAEVSVRPVESDYWKVAGQALHGLGKRSLIILFTDLLDPCASKGLVTHLCQAAKKHVVLCVLLKDPDLEKELESSDPARKAAASYLAVQRQVAITEMRRRGVVVLESPADGFQSRVLQQYLQLRERA